MQNRFAAAMVALLTFAGGPTLADRLVVVELFTSQGCSSCPPADALLGELTRQEGVLPLALHVDYWDYIGWKDEFARPEHTLRQKAYAAAFGTGTIYTPQMVVGGKDHVVGFKPGRLAKLLMQHADSPAAVTVSAEWEGKTVVVTVTPVGMSKAADIVLVRYLKERAVSIYRGENAGRDLTYHNIVADMRRIGTWDGEEPYTTRAETSGDGEYAVLVQRPDAGPVLAAATLP